MWDYASDGYVHRLVQSKTDGKLVEVPSPAQAACGERLSTAGPEYVFVAHQTLLTHAYPVETILLRHIVFIEHRYVGLVFGGRCSH